MLMLALVLMPMAIHAQTDDMYFVPSKAKKAEEKVEKKVVERVVDPAPETEAEEADYHSGSLRDVDEYNRRGSRQVLARLDGDTLYVQQADTLPDKEYLVRYQDEDYYADSEFRDDYYYAMRLHRYHGFYYRDPFLWDVCFGWYDPWYDPWYGWYGPYYRFGWCAWDSWGWGWGYHYPGWCHGWGPGWHHGWVPTPHRPYRPGGSALANRGYRAGSGLAGGSSVRGGRTATSTVSRSSAMSGLRSSRMLNSTRVATDATNVRVPSRTVTSRGARVGTSSRSSLPTTSSSSRSSRSSMPTVSSSSRGSMGSGSFGGGSFGGGRSSGGGSGASRGGRGGR